MPFLRQIISERVFEIRLVVFWSIKQFLIYSCSVEPTVTQDCLLLEKIKVRKPPQNYKINLLNRTRPPFETSFQMIYLYFL